MISVTALSSYIFCPRKLWLSRVLKFKEPLKDVVVLGTIIHQAIHELNISEELIVSSINRADSDEVILEKYVSKSAERLKSVIIRQKRNLRVVEVSLTAAFTRMWPIVQNQAKFRGRQVCNIKKQTSSFGEELWRSLTPKIKSEYRIKSETIGLRGIIDYLEIHDNMLIPVELKTGRQPEQGVWPGHRVQVGAYALMIEEKFGITVDKALVRYLATGQEEAIVMNPFIREEVLQLRDKARLTIESTSPPPICKDERKCASCSFKPRCHDEQLIRDKAKDLNNSRGIAIVQ